MRQIDRRHGLSSACGVVWWSGVPSDLLGGQEGRIWAGELSNGAGKGAKRPKVSWEIPWKIFPWLRGESIPPINQPGNIKNMSVVCEGIFFECWNSKCVSFSFGPQLFVHRITIKQASALGTRLALQLVHSVQTQDLDARFCLARHCPPCVRIGCVPSSDVINRF